MNNSKEDIIIDVSLLNKENKNNSINLLESFLDLKTLINTSDSNKDNLLFNVAVESILSRYNIRIDDRVTSIELDEKVDSIGSLYKEHLSTTLACIFTDNGFFDMIIGILLKSTTLNTIVDTEYTYIKPTSSSIMLISPISKKIDINYLNYSLSNLSQLCTLSLSLLEETCNYCLDLKYNINLHLNSLYNKYTNLPLSGMLLLSNTDIEDDKGNVHSNIERIQKWSIEFKNIKDRDTLESYIVNQSNLSEDDWFTFCSKRNILDPTSITKDNMSNDLLLLYIVELNKMINCLNKVKEFIISEKFKDTVNYISKCSDDLDLISNCKLTESKVLLFLSSIRLYNDINYNIINYYLKINMEIGPLFLYKQ